MEMVTVKCRDCGVARTFDADEETHRLCEDCEEMERLTDEQGAAYDAAKGRATELLVDSWRDGEADHA